MRVIRLADKKSICLEMDVNGSNKLVIDFTGDAAVPSTGFSQRQVKPGMVNHSGIAAESVEIAIGLGDLYGLTVTNEASPLSDVSK